MGKDLVTVGGMLIGVALIALLVGNSRGTVALIDASSGIFAGLLGVVTMQTQMATPY
jgi:hypothetical protein